jgi:hypothetical protein
MFLETWFKGKGEKTAPENIPETRVQEPEEKTDEEKISGIDAEIEKEINNLREIASMLRDHPSMEGSGEDEPEIHFLRRYAHEARKDPDPEGKLFAKFLYDFAHGNDPLAEKEMRNDIRQKIEKLREHVEKHPIGESSGHSHS